MAPYDVTTWGSFAEPAIHVVLGMGFGFVLERAGFGSAKKLTNQFYLNDMTVLKVMFTAIITAMVLILAATTVGLLDYDKLWINPTYLGSGIVGGLLFGVGFVVGGYCPGTALVSAATLKLDGLLFTIGVLGGIFVFGYTEPVVDGFWNDSGNFGRLTLFDWLGLPMPSVVLMVVAMALVFFAAAEWIERRMKSPNEDLRALSGRRGAYGFAGALVATAALCGLLWRPTESLRRGTTQARIEQSIRKGLVQIDARELADLMRDKALGLVLLDVRDESSFNRFHLIDARRLELGTSSRQGPLPQRSVKVILGDDEASELSAYRRLAAENVENLYVLARGMPAWFELFESRGSGVRLAALGANHPESRPPELVKLAAAGYVAKVKRPGIGGKKSGGGCGG